MSETPPQASKTRRPLRRWLIDLGLVLAAFIAIHWWQTRPLASGPAPELSGQLLDGTAVNLQDFAGQTVLVHFWATWCPVCKAEQGGIQALSEDFPVISVAMQSGSANEVRTFMAEQGLNFKVINDPYGEMSSAWGVRAVPASFVVDRAGLIRFTEVGFTTEPGLRARLWAAAKLSAPVEQARAAD